MLVWILINTALPMPLVTMLLTECNTATVESRNNELSQDDVGDICLHDVAFGVKHRQA